jgi:hypothetical protein
LFGFIAFGEITRELGCGVISSLSNNSIPSTTAHTAHLPNTSS